MKKFLAISLLSVICYLLSTAPAVVQAVELEECQNYYQFGEVKVNLNTKKTSYLPGEKVELFGSVVNKNSFPLLNITIFAHLKRINEETYLENGHFLVDKFRLGQSLNFLPKETKHFSVSFEVKNNYPAGKYQLQYFVFSQEGFSYSGRPYLEEDFAGVTNFNIQNAPVPSVYFDVNSLEVNGQPQKVRDYLPIFSKGEDPGIAVNLADLRTAKSDLSVLYKWYRWDDSFEENLVKTGSFPLSADQIPTFQTSFDLEEAGAYVLLLEINQPVRSLFKFRIARRGEKASNLRMNDLGVTGYPVDPKKDRAFVCFHSPAEEEAPRTGVTLSLLDKTGQVLEQKTVEDSFSGEVMAISVPLTKLTDPLNFSIEGNFQDLEDPFRSQKVRREFKPERFKKSLVDLKVDYQPDGVGGPKLNLKAINVSGEDIEDQPLEKLVVYQDGKIIDEQYNLDSIPGSYDLSGLSSGKYQLLVKSGAIEKEMDFSVGAVEKPVDQKPEEEKPAAEKNYWWLIILTLIGLIGLIIVIWKRRKASQGNTSEVARQRPRLLRGEGIGERATSPPEKDKDNET